jgi:hypothetical protein
VSNSTFAPSKAHLRRAARREVLHVHRRRDHRAGQAQALGDVAFHLRAQHQLGLQLGDARFHLEVVVGDQRLDAVELGGLAHFARELAAVGAQADHLKPISWRPRARRPPHGWRRRTRTRACR